jgi:hypothetical protein
MKIKRSRKLTLSKSTVVNLENAGMGAIKCGGDTETCYTFNENDCLHAETNLTCPNPNTIFMTDDPYCQLETYPETWLC